MMSDSCKADLRRELDRLVKRRKDIDAAINAARLLLGIIRTKRLTSSDAKPPAIPDVQAANEPTSRLKNPAAVALGRLGGKKGGLARAANLSKERRSEIATQAANVRWKPKLVG